MAEYTQSDLYTRTFLMVLASDHVTGATGKTVTVTLSKAGGAFAAAVGTVTEIGNGWYSIRLTAADTDTPGDLAFHCTATACDDTDFVDQVLESDATNTTTRTTAATGSRTAGEIIEDALLLCNGLDQDEPVDGASTTIAIRRMNDILRGWHTRGLHEWRKQEVVIPLVDGQEMYLLGSETTDAYWADEEDFYATTVATAAVSGATTLVLTSGTNYTNGDYVGIELDDGTRQWTTATKSSNTLTLADALSDDVSEGATVYMFTDRPSRPLRVLHARRRSATDANDIPVRIEAHNFYRDQPSKETTGTPVHVYYQPTLDSGRLYVWQPAGDVEQQLRLTVERPFSLVGSTADIPDIPDEWNEALTYVLATRLEPTYGHLDAARVRDLRADAARFEMDCLSFDTDTGSLYFAPARR